MTNKKLSRASYIKAVDAARIFDLQGDYVTRLAKRGDVRGEKKGRVWYVEIGSLEEYFLRQVYERAKRNMHLATVRASERRSGVVRKGLGVRVPISGNAIHMALTKALLRRPLDHVAHRAVTHLHNHNAPLYAVTPALDFLHKVGAMVVASVVTFVIASGVHASLSETSDKTSKIGGGYANIQYILEGNTAMLGVTLECLSFSSACFAKGMLDQEPYIWPGLAEINITPIKNDTEIR